MSLFVSPIREEVATLTDEEIASRHHISPLAPDFRLSALRSADAQHDNFSIRIPLSTLIGPCATAMSRFYTYDGSERTAGYAVTGIFAGIPNCRMIRYGSSALCYA